MLVDLQLHAWRPPREINRGSAARALPVSWVLPSSAFDAIVESPGAALPRGHDIPPSGGPQKASSNLRHDPLGDSHARAGEAHTARRAAAGAPEATTLPPAPRCATSGPGPAVWRLVRQL